MHRKLLFLIFSFFLATISAAQAMESLTAEESFKVIQIIDGDTLVLENKHQVRLVGLQAPKLPLGRKNFKEWPLAKESKETLEALSLGKIVQLRYGGAKMDRHGRLLAHLVRADGLWIQQEMLRRGMARVYTFPDNRAVVDQMLVAEKKARHAKAGIWGHPFYKVRSAQYLYKDLNTFQVVEGAVVDAALVKGTTYLNYGQDWRKDFTVKIRKKAAGLFNQVGLDLLSLKGKRLRVRGWLKKQNGPLIEVTHPEQIEIIE